MRLVIFGPPAVGKGTHAARISDTYGIPHLSTGEMLRAAIAQGSRVGQRAKAIMAKGGLVPDAIVVKIVSERTMQPDCGTGFILDGFPRTLRQARAFDRVLRSRKLALDHVIALEAEEAALVQRVVNRANEARAAGKPVRPDDDPDVFRKRLKVYRAETAPVLPHYQRQGKIRTIDGMKSVDEVAAAIDAAIKAPPTPRKGWLRWLFGL